MSEQSEIPPAQRVVSASSSRNAAALMNYGNIVAIVVVPLVVIWFGASMLVYAMNRHHPDPKVGHYTQQAAYRFYGVVGFFAAAAIFIPGDGWTWYIVAWILAAAVIIPWSILDLVRIYRDQWADISIEDATEQ